MSRTEWRPDDGRERIDELDFGDALAELSIIDVPEIDPVDAVRESREDA